MLERLLEQAGELPSLPEVYIRVTELLETESATADEIGEALQSDPALTARVLKLINSAYYGLRNEVSSIPQAVILLGREQLQQVLLGSVLSKVFKDFNVSDFPLRDFWQHCIKTAIIARQLAMQNARIIDHEAFFTVGLLHDIGWLVIARVNPGSYMQINDIAKAENRNMLEVEIEKLGTTHSIFHCATFGNTALKPRLSQDSSPCKTRESSITRLFSPSGYYTISAGWSSPG